MTPSTIVTKPSRRLVAALGVVAATCTFLVTAGGTAGAASSTTQDSVVARDSFAGSTRTVGDAEIGGRWAVQAPAGGSITTGGNQLGVSPVPRGGSYAVGLPSVSAADVTVKHGLRLPTITSAKLGLYETTELRRQADGDRYQATLTVGSGGALSLSADRAVDGQSTQLAKVALPLKATSNGWLTVETKVSGTSPVTVQARVYPAGTTAPGWQVTATDSSAAAVKQAGSVGLNGFLSSSGTPTGLGLNAFQAVATTLAAPAPVASSSPRPVQPTPAPTATTNPAPAPSTPAPSTPAQPGGLPVLQRVVTNGFVHPGILNGTTNLEASRAAVLAGKSPQKPAFDKMKSSRFANLSWTPHPVAYVGCGSYNVVDEGCTAETDDAQAAYTQALLWYYTGDQRYADKAKQILNAYSGTLKDHKFDTKVYKNGLLQAGWAGQTFTKAAELIRYSGAGWSASDVARFETMLKTAFLPRVINGWTWTSANWQLTMAEATMNIGVFTNDRATWDNGVGDWRNHVKGSFYLASDGSKPNFPANTIMKDSNYLEYWSSPKQFVNGLAAETCRDASHTAMGLAAALDGAETARIQGLDLYGEQRTRLVAAMEYNLRFVNNPSASGWVCAKPLNLGGTGYKLTFALGYNNYAVRGGMSLPETQKFLSTVSPTGSGIFMNWETLTHSAG